MNLFEIAIPEVWENILEQARAADRHTLLETYPQLGVEFHNRKKFMLFELIIPHLLEHSREIKWDVLLICRLVCKRWCRAIENFIMFSNTDLVTLQNGKYLRTRSAAELVLVLDEMKLHPPGRNPILSRSLSLRLLEESNKGNEEIEILNSIGKHVWFLRFLLMGWGRLHSEPFAANLELSLRCTPNLRALSFKEVLYGFNHQDSELSRLIVLPNLPYLRAISFDNHGCIPEKVAEIILHKYKGQLANLHMDLKYWKEEYNGNFFPSLETLVLTGLVDSESPEILKRMFINLKVDGLKQIILVTRYPFGVNSEDFKRIMQTEMDLSRALQNNYLSLLKNNCQNVKFLLKTWF